MQSIQALRERRSVLAQSIHEMLEQHPGDKWNADLQARYDEGMAEIDDIAAESKRIQDYLDKVAEEATRDAIGTRAEQRGRDERKPEMALWGKWLKGGDKALNAEDWITLRNAMSTTTPAEGGYTVPTEVASQLVDALKKIGGVREVATVITTSASGDLNFPTSDGTAEVGELIGQNTTATAADPTFGVVTITAYKYSSKIVAVPFELLQDTAIDMEGFIRKRLAERLGRITNQHFTTGSGTAQPRGVITGAGTGKTGTTGQTTTVIFDDLVDLVHSVDPAYRSAGTCRFMMNDGSLGKVRKLKDTAGRPIFIPGWDGLAGPMADTLLGYGVVINQDVAAMAANARSIAFGDMAKYVVRDVMALTMFRFDDSAYVKLGQIGFLAWVRSGGNLTDSGAVKVYINSAT